MSETLSDKPAASRQPTPHSDAPASTADPSPATRPGWADTLRVYLEAPALRMLLLGFSAGLPLLLVFGTLSF